MKLKTIKPETMSDTVKEKEWYPHLDLSSDEIKEIENWEVGKNYKIVLEVRQVSKREDKDKKISACFEVRKVGVSNPEYKEISDKIKSL